MTALAGDSRADADVEDARETLAEFKANDAELQAHLDEAVAYVVFQEVGKGGFVFAGGQGEGILFENNIPRGRVSLRLLSVGAQVGGQRFSELIIIKDASALKNFKRGRAELQAGVSAVGAGKSASRQLQYQDGIAVMTRVHSGVMAEASVGRQKFTFQRFEKETQPGT
ncbi:MAG: lipid-binding SYLF domain-containing protein [Myxococcaceae bacterium]|nr:lipid-binding SYLF domain-containing protein [Myxococcaceae bacterium]